MERETARPQWQLHRTAKEGSTIADLASRKWADVYTTYPPGANGLIFLSSRHMKLEVRFRTNGIAGDTANYKIYLFRDKGDAKFCASGVATFGTQASSDQIDGVATRYASAITIVTDAWIYPVSSTHTSGTTEQASIFFDAAGYNYALVLLTGMSLDGSNSNSVAVDMSGWN
jgi:hypothetical protein